MISPRGEKDALKRKRVNAEQFVTQLKQVKPGAPVAAYIRHLRNAGHTSYRWKRRYAGLESRQVWEFKQLQEKNAKLKQLVAELSLGTVMLQNVLAGIWWAV